MDVLRLIEEVKKRPILWDHRPDNKDRPNLTAIWQQVADELGSSVKSCKAKWRNLRDAFRAEVRRSQRRAEKYKNVCKNDPRAKGTSKWAYFVPLSFLVKSQRPAIASSASGSASPTQSRTKRNKNNDDHSNSQHSNEEKTATSTTATTAAAAALASAQPASASYVHDSEDSNCISFASDYDIKEEAVLILSDDDNDEEEDFEVDIDAEMFHNDEEDQDMLFNQFQNLATPQAMRRLSHSISVANAAAEEQQHKHEHQQQQQQQQEDLERKIESSDFGNKIDILPAVNAIESETSEPTTTATTTSPTTSATEANQDCKCAKRVDEQVHFLENLEREEEKLIKSTRQDITRCKEMLHVGDSDYNFLISFLPLMKKMSDLQNIHFRAKMSELLVHTMGMGPPAPSAVHTASSLSQVIATPLSSFNPASICTSAQTQPQLFILQQAPPNAATPVTTNAQIQQPIGNAQVTTSTTTQWN